MTNNVNAFHKETINLLAHAKRIYFEVSIIRTRNSQRELISDSIFGLAHSKYTN